MPVSNRSFGENGLAAMSPPRRSPGSPMLMSARSPALLDFDVRREQGARPYLEDTFSHRPLEGGFLFGVFDGHGGSRAADFCKAHLLEMVAQRLDPRLENVPQALTAAFLQAEDKFMEMARPYSWTDGSTALVVCIAEGWLHVAHCGDTRLMLVREGVPSFAMLTEDHKPDNPREYQRIIQLGATVEQRPGDILRVVPGQLAVSRSIGDARAKPAVTAEPEVQSIPIERTWKALILATDGLWDVVPLSVCTDICNRASNARQAADQLVETALNMKSGDNVTAMVVFFRPPGPEGPGFPFMLPH